MKHDEAGGAALTERAIRATARERVDIVAVQGEAVRIRYPTRLSSDAMAVARRHWEDMFPGCSIVVND